MPALLIGSIGALVETSELQREAFNGAFLEHGLDWVWEREDYASRLADSGGAARVARYAEDRGEEVDAFAVHHTKTRLFQERIAKGGLEPRPGVAETIEAVKGAGHRLGFVSATAPGTVSTLLHAVEGRIDPASFDFVFDAVRAGTPPKPAPDAYRTALEAMNERADACLAVEDNADGVAAATAAGLACLAFPGANTQDHDYSAATAVVRGQLDPEDVLARLNARGAA